MLVLDIILLGILVFGPIKGLVKGFIVEIMSLVGVIIAVYVAKTNAETLGQTFAEWLDCSLMYAKPIAYGFIFASVVLLCYLLAKLLSGFVKLVMLDWLNRLLGAVFGLLKYALILSVLINVFAVINNKLNFLKEGKTAQSYLYTPLKNLAPGIMPFVYRQDFETKNAINQQDSIQTISNP